MHLSSLETTCDLTSPLLLGYGDVGLPGRVPCICLLMIVTTTTTAVLISFALHMDKTLHPKTTLRVYYMITVTGE